MRRVWVRALVAPAVFVAWFVGLWFVGVSLPDGLGHPLLLVAALSLFVALFIGPAWILQPLMTTPPGRPPRGGLRLLPLRTPESTESASTQHRPAA